MNSSREVQQLDLYTLLRDILKNIWTVILAALIGLMSIYIWNRGVYVPQYTSTATLLVNIKNSASYSYTSLSASSEIAQIFTKVFVQPTMKEHAASYLGAPSFSGQISSSSLSNTNIFTVSVTSSSPELSYEELCAVLEVYPEISGAIFSNCVIDVLRSPDLPAGPSNSISQKNARRVALICAAVDLFLVALLSYLRDTVKNEKFFKKKIDAKLFGTVCHERQSRTIIEYIRRRLNHVKEAPLVGNAYTSFAFTENYQKIASRFEYMKRHENAKVFLLTSGAENEGKSTVAANIALTLAARKNRVLLLDMDFKKPALHKIFSIPKSNTPDFALVLSGKCAPEDFTFTQYKDSKLRLAINQTSHFDYVDWIHSEHTTAFLKALRDSDEYDFIILDTPPLSVAADNTALAQIADSTLLVVRTDCVFVGELNDMILSLSDSSKHFSGCILNDIHKEFDFLTQFGLDESGSHSNYNGYYGGYGAYGGYGKSSYPKASDTTSERK